MQINNFLSFGGAQAVIPLWPRMTLVPLSARRANANVVQHNPKAQTVDEPDHGTYKIRVANNSDRRCVAAFLVEKMYGARGYRVSKSAPLSPNSISMLVYDEQDDPIGTFTANPDGPQGLLADEGYADVLAPLRQKHQLLELGRFAIQSDSGDTKRILASLMNAGYVYGKSLGCSYLMIEVNPRHVPIYQAGFGMEPIGPERTCSRVNAPSILHGLDFNHVANQVNGCRSGGGAKSGRNLYRHFVNTQHESAWLNGFRR